MKKLLLFLASLAIWMIGSFLLIILGNMYISYAHPDGISYGASVLRELLFGIPDILLLSAGLSVFGASVAVSPYRKATGLILLVSGVYYGIKGICAPESIGSIYVHILNNGWQVVMGLMGLFGKSYEETNAVQARAL